LHFAVAKLRREHCRSDWQWTHIANGELRDIRTAAKIKAMGVRRSWPDFILVPPQGQLHCLELKRASERLSDDQAALGHGVPHAVCRSLDEALGMLDSWGCLTIMLTSRRGGAK
jgi:hypothetical protein